MIINILAQTSSGDPNYDDAYHSTPIDPDQYEDAHYPDEDDTNSNDEDKDDDDE